MPGVCRTLANMKPRAEVLVPEYHRFSRFKHGGIADTWTEAG